VYAQFATGERTLEVWVPVDQQLTGPQSQQRNLYQPVTALTPSPGQIILGAVLLAVSTALTVAAAVTVARAILGLPVDTALREAGASAVIYGGMEEKGIAFTRLAEALAVPRSDLRLFGKPESFVKRRMGVAVANGETTDQARQRAKLVASTVKPVKA
jgi:formate-dependent phosphoribosylglycinamide formyltransferase (GAR transformylase)